MKMHLQFLLLIQFFSQLLPVCSVSVHPAHTRQDASAGVIQRVHPRDNLVLMKRMEHPLQPSEVSELVQTSTLSDHGMPSPISDIVIHAHQ